MFSTTFQMQFIEMNLEEPFAAFAGSDSIVLTCGVVTTNSTHVLQRPDVALPHDVTAIRKVLASIRTTSELKVIHFVCIVGGLVVVAVVGVAVKAGKCQKIKTSSSIKSFLFNYATFFRFFVEKVLIIHDIQD